MHTFPILHVVQLAALNINVLHINDNMILYIYISQYMIMHKRLD